jgi:phage terminase large subunit-like protein
MNNTKVKYNSLSNISDGHLLSYCRDNVIKDLRFFVPLAFKMMYPNIPYQHNWHIDYISEIIQNEITRITKREPKVKDIIINVPPRSLKSFIGNVAAPAWSWVVNPYMKWISTSHTRSLSVKHNVDCRRLIENTSYLKMFPEIMLSDDENQKMRFSNIFGGYKITTSVDSGITGEGADIILVDDPLDPRKAKSDVERQNAIDHITNVLSSRLNDQRIGVMIIIMQRLHENDPVGYLLKRNPDKYTHICIPAHYQKDRVKPLDLGKYYKNGLFFPSRFPEIVLSDIRDKMPINEYEGQYEQDPVAKAGNIIKRDWFHPIKWNDFIRLYNSLPYIVEKTFTCDTAFTDKKENDASCILGGCLINNNLYLFKGKKVRLGFPELIKWIKVFLPANLYDHTSSLRIEPKANGISLVQTLQAEAELNVVSTPTPKDSKEVRLTSISKIIEGGRVFVVEPEEPLITVPTNDNENWAEEFISDVCGFPHRTDKEYVDCLYYMIDYYFNDTVKKRFGVQKLFLATINMDKYTFYPVISACPLWDNFEFVVTGVYFAKNVNDFDVFTTFGIDKDSNMFLINFYRQKFQTNTNTIEQLLGIYQNFRPNVVCVEDDYYEKTFKNIRNNGVEIKVKTEKESSFTNSFDDSLDTISIWFEQSKIKLPYYESIQPQIWDIFREFSSLDVAETKIKQLVDNKGITKAFWLSLKACFMVNSGIQF